MSFKSVVRIRELYHHIAVYLSSTDAYSLSQAVDQPFEGYEKHLLQPWRDCFTNLDWTNALIEILEVAGLNAEVLVVGPYIVLPQSLSCTYDYSVHRKELGRLELPYLNVYVVLNNSPLLSFRSLWALKRQLRWLMYHLDCIDTSLSTGNFTLEVVQSTNCAPLIRYCAPMRGTGTRQPLRPTSNHRLADPPSMGYIMATRDGIRIHKTERVSCYSMAASSIYITVGGFKGDRVKYATFEISRPA